MASKRDGKWNSAEYRALCKFSAQKFNEAFDIQAQCCALCTLVKHTKRPAGFFVKMSLFVRSRSVSQCKAKFQKSEQAVKLYVARHLVKLCRKFNYHLPFDHAQECGNAPGREEAEMIGLPPPAEPQIVNCGDKSVGTNTNQISAGFDFVSAPSDAQFAGLSDGISLIKRLAANPNLPSSPFENLSSFLHSSALDEAAHSGGRPFDLTMDVEDALGENWHLQQDASEQFSAIVDTLVRTRRRSNRDIIAQKLKISLALIFKLCKSGPYCHNCDVLARREAPDDD